MRRPLLRSGAVWAALFAWCAPPLSASAEEAAFLLGPGDKLGVVVHRRPDLSGEFRVAPDGTLSVPYVGAVAVSGRPLDAARDALAERVRSGAHLLDPRVSVELVEARPVTVSGGVRRPGPVPAHHGMTVRHAVAAAGGMRALDLEEVALGVEVGRLRERLRGAHEALGLAHLRRARLLAEATDADAFGEPPEARAHLASARLEEAREAEARLLRLRNEAHRALLAMLGAQVDAYNDEIRALMEQAESKAREAELLSEEGRYVDSLQRQGLSPRTTRVVELRRMAVQVEGERRQIAAYVARARQEIARVAQARASAATQRRVEVAGALKEAEDAIGVGRVSVEEVRAALARLRESLPPEGVALGTRPPSEYAILRGRGPTSPPLRLAATADSPVLPGDLVEVSLGGDDAPPRATRAGVGLDAAVAADRRTAEAGAGVRVR